MTKTTLHKLIEQLQALEQIHGGNTLVATYDEYTASEGWDYEEEDLYLDVEPTFDEDTKIILL